MVSGSSQENALSPAAPPKGVSGRKLTIAVLVGLVAVVGTLIYTLACYNKIDSARSDVDQAWRELAEQLSDRYRGIELKVAEGVDSRQIKMELGERFRLAIDRFRGTAIPENQFAAAAEMEALLDDTGLLEDTDVATLQRLDKYNQQVELAQRELQTLGGRILSVFLRFPTLEPLKLAQASPEATSSK